jgi:hypothetical protein
MLQFCNTIVTVAQPKVRPLERFWPPVDLPEHVSAEDLVAPDPGRPFSITLVFSPLDAADFGRALDLASQSPGFSQTGTGVFTRYRARFLVGDAARLLEVFSVVQRSSSTDVLVDDQAVPYGRELWIPLVGFFLNP